MFAQTNSTTLLSTVLFVNGCPIGYQLIRQGDTVHLRPDSLMAAQSDIPEIVARRNDSGWSLPAALDRDLAAQVLEDLEHLIHD